MYIYCNMKLEINKGSRYGNFEVIKELPRKRLPSGQTNRVFLCECVCGKSKEIRLGHLTRCKINSCGCIKLRHSSVTDNDKYIRKIWRAIKYRTAENYSERHLYFDKGIKVCEQWQTDYNSFYCWALQNNLKKGLQIDRIDGNRGYNQINCRVVTPTVNANNRENTTIVNYRGVDYPFMDLIRDKGIKCSATIRGRLKRGWCVNRAFEMPVKKGNYRITKRRLEN